MLLDHASNFLGEFVSWLFCGFSFLDEGFVFDVISEESSGFSDDGCGFLVFQDFLFEIGFFFSSLSIKLIQILLVSLDFSLFLGN